MDYFEELLNLFPNSCIVLQPTQMFGNEYYMELYIDDSFVFGGHYPSKYLMLRDYIFFEYKCRIVTRLNLDKMFILNINTSIMGFDVVIDGKLKTTLKSKDYTYESMVLALKNYYHLLVYTTKLDYFDEIVQLHKDKLVTIFTGKDYKSLFVDEKEVYRVYEDFEVSYVFCEKVLFERYLLKKYSQLMKEIGRQDLLLSPENSTNSEKIIAWKLEWEKSKKKTISQTTAASMTGEKQEKKEIIIDGRKFYV